MGEATSLSQSNELGRAFCLLARQKRREVQERLEAEKDIPSTPSRKIVHPDSVNSSTPSSAQKYRREKRVSITVPEGIK
eukprot:gene12949-3790_t